MTYELTADEKRLPKTCPKCSGEESLFVVNDDHLKHVSCEICAARGFGARDEKSAVDLFLSAGVWDQEGEIRSSVLSYFPYGCDEQEQLVRQAQEVALSQADRLGIVYARLNLGDVESLFESAFDAECAEAQGMAEVDSSSRAAEGAWLNRRAL